MRCEIIDLKGNRTRRVWDFYLLSGNSEFQIVVDHWKYQTLPPRARKWRTNNYWDRLLNQDNITKEYPPIPDEIRQQVKAFYVLKLFSAVDKMVEGK